jgi:CheY-like chemotaxis protein
MSRSEAGHGAIQTSIVEATLQNSTLWPCSGGRHLYRRDTFTTRSNDTPAVLLLDLKLSKIGGLGVLQQIKSDQKIRMIPGVVLTTGRK